MGSKPSSTKKEDIGDHLNLPFVIPKEEVFVVKICIKLRYIVRFS